MKFMTCDVRDGHPPEGSPYHQWGKSVPDVSVSQTSMEPRTPGEDLTSG